MCSFWINWGLVETERHLENILWVESCFSIKSCVWVGRLMKKMEQLEKMFWRWPNNRPFPGKPNSQISCLLSSKQPRPQRERKLVDAIHARLTTSENVGSAFSWISFAIYYQSGFLGLFHQSFYFPSVISASWNETPHFLQRVERKNSN